MNLRVLRRRVAALVVLLAASSAVPADAYRPLLHEFIPPDDGEDVALAVTTAEGDLPAAIETPSGVVRAPDTQRPPSAKDSAYREPLSPALPSVYRADRDTRRPSVVRYDDPFSPSIAPYKRLRAFDMVGQDYALRVRDTSLARVAVGGNARVGEDEFYADLTIDFEASGTVLIPSVGPGARILRQHATPQVPVEVWRDGAENWYAKAEPSPKGRVRLVMQLAIARDAFGGELVMPAWPALTPGAPLPPAAASAVGQVSHSLGLSRAVSPLETVKRLVSYFRAFVPSEEPPRGHDDIYLDLALSQKGVCRHRAFAFLVTALGLGIPARMVINEAHAWVEVRGERGWQRIDLGGAAGAIDEPTSDARPNYRPPADAFEWPASDDGGSGRQAALRGRQAASSSIDRSSSEMEGDPFSAPASQPSPESASPQAVAPDARRAHEPTGDRGAADSPDERPRARITMRGKDVDVHRSEPIVIAGKVESDGAGCGQLRVDIALKSVASGVKTKVGALTTDASGAFDGRIVLPLQFPVGEYEVNVSTPGDARCGAGASAP